MSLKPEAWNPNKVFCLSHKNDWLDGCLRRFYQCFASFLEFKAGRYIKIEGIYIAAYIDNV